MTYVCIDTVPRLGELVEHALPAAERDAVDRHLAICPRCQELLASLLVLPGTLRALLEVRPPENLADRVLAALG